ncbi:hypothetical protein CASFOL_026840 [Castilleja foliolosa]|uniref:Uncharacterized protein n=1 Tax=Castilleja foliolosa TaxID=1961234 RepID=A0ABD3CI70_9LAMI
MMVTRKADEYIANNANIGIARKVTTIHVFEPSKKHKQQQTIFLRHSIFFELVDTVAVNQKRSKTKASGTSSSKRRRADVVFTSQSSDPIDSTQAEDDDIEEFSSTSQDMSASDEDWAA